jgi:hypothetical protein
LRQQTVGDEQREVGVHVTGRLDSRVERLLNQLPDGIAVRPDDHAAFHRRVVGELSTPDDVEIPPEKSCERGVISVTNDSFSGLGIGFFQKDKDTKGDSGHKGSILSKTSTMWHCHRASSRSG